MIEIGVIGAAILVLAWIFETINSVRKNKLTIDLRFAVMYLASTAILLVYSLQNGDVIFLFVNACLLILVSFEVAYSALRGKRWK